MPDAVCRRRREATFATRHPNSQVPLLDAAKDALTDTATGVMDYGVSSGQWVLRMAWHVSANYRTIHTVASN